MFANPKTKSKSSIEPRLSRLLTALLKRPLMREQADRIAGVSNSPDLIMNARRQYDLDIPCERIRGLDRDRNVVRPGRYSLTAKDRAKVRQLLRGES